MIPRTRFLTTACLLCQLLLGSAMLTTRLHAAPVPQNSTGSGSQSPQNQAQGADVYGNPAQNAAPAPAQAPARKPSMTATDDKGNEDTDTEQIIQQEISSSEQTGPPRPAMNTPLGHNEVLIRADEQEKKQDIYYGRGNVEIRFGTYVLDADQATYDSTTGIVKATGHVVFNGGPRNEHVVGNRAVYDVSRDSGTFYDATGSIGAKIKNRQMFLTSSTPFFFKGKEVSKLGPDRYVIHQGYVTSCQLPKPKWVLDSKTANVEVGDEAVMRHATLKVDGIPVFYFPFVEHPADNFARKSGFLLPEVGSSTTRGTIFGDAFYWAISRNADATIGAANYSKRGPAETDVFRAVGYDYGAQANFYAVQDMSSLNQGGEELKVNLWKQLPDDFRGVLSADYLSAYIFRLAFAQGFSEAIFAEVRSTGFIFKTWDGYSFGVLGSSYRNYESLTAGDSIQIVHEPSLELSTVERTFDRSNFVYAFDVAAEGLNRNEPNFETAPVVGRFDLAPHIAWPKLFHGWTVRPELGARETVYSQRLIAIPGPTTTYRAVDDGINRNVANASLEVRPPTLEKVFDHKPFGRVLKHTFEPYAIYRYQTGINDFSQIILFDYRDILANTNEVEYGVVNRLYVKKTSLSAKCFQSSEPLSLSQGISERLTAAQKACEDKSGPSGDVVTWEIAQKYFGNTTFGGALVPGTRNVFDSTEELTGIAFLTEPRRFSPVVSRFRVQSGPVDFQWAFDYDPVLHQVNANTIFAGYHWRNWYLNGGESYLNAPGEAMTTSSGTPIPNVFNQWRVGLIYGALNRPGLSGGFSTAVDSRTGYLQNVTYQSNYNWDCCGLAFEYARWDIPGVRDENSYRFSFSLANVGSFGTIGRLTRLY